MIERTCVTRQLRTGLNASHPTPGLDLGPARRATGWVKPGLDPATALCPSTFPENRRGAAPEFFLPKPCLEPFELGRGVEALDRCACIRGECVLYGCRELRLAAAVDFVRVHGPVNISRETSMRS